MLKRRLAIAAIVIVVVIAGPLLAACLWQKPGEVLTPAGFKRNTAIYIDMPDGARIAADLWLPADLEPGEKIPAVIEGTRYWRATGLTLLGRTAAMFGMALPDVDPAGYNAFFPAKGYAMLTVDVRGTGASSGVHTTEYSVEEAADYFHIIDWVASQPWSSGDVFAVGVSYSGTSAELMTTANHTALKAVAPLYSDFDAQMQLATPGGVYQPAFIELWSTLVAAMDRNDLCALARAEDPQASCWLPKLLVSGVKPVDGEADFLPRAIASHNSPNVARMIQKLEYRDSAWGTTEVQPNENLPYGLKDKIERSATPMFVVTGWFDAATSNGALARFATFSNPQEVWVGGFSHGGDHDTDPYKAVDAPSAWEGNEQLERVLDFFERHRSDRSDAPSTTGVVNYYINGANTFRQTSAWPPAHLQPRQLYLGPDQTLADLLPRGRAFARYRVDETTATSPSSRWMTQLGGSDVHYARRAEMTEKLLTFTSPQFTEDTELTGSPALDLWMTSDVPEGALHAYLEDVSPTGEIRYLTEGVLNLQHRANTDTPAYPTFGPDHSFLQRDARSLPQGQLFSFSTTLFATSALIKRGHKLRLSLAGADATSFARVPADGPMPTWNIYFGPTSPSALTIMVAPWNHSDTTTLEETE